MKLHLSLDSTFLKNDAGQRIDQTNLGLLIRNISLSLTDKRRGKLKISERDSLIIIKVLADDHFLLGIRTLYRFFIDRSLWLPVEVEEFSPDGIMKRKVIFRDMRTSIILPEAFFQVE